MFALLGAWRSRSHCRRPAGPALAAGETTTCKCQVQAVVTIKARLIYRHINPIIEHMFDNRGRASSPEPSTQSGVVRSTAGVDPAGRLPSLVNSVRWRATEQLVERTEAVTAHKGEKRAEVRVGKTVSFKPQESVTGDPSSGSCLLLGKTLPQAKMSQPLTYMHSQLDILTLIAHHLQSPLPLAATMLLSPFTGHLDLSRFGCTGDAPVGRPPRMHTRLGTIKLASHDATLSGLDQMGGQ